MHENLKEIRKFELTLYNLENIYYHDILNSDEQEELPWDFLNKIHACGYTDFLIPTQYGGKLDNLYQLYLLTKSIAKRDVTSAIVRGLAYFSAIPIWIAGNETQIKWTTEQIKAGEVGSIALTEFDHGSDIGANETTALIDNNQLVINGSKWAINHAKFCYSSVLLVRTAKQASPLAYSLVLMDKSKVTSGLQYTDRLFTHGARGLEISGFTFDNMSLPTDCFVGEKGQGLALTYKTLQISRTLCSAISSGASENALAMAIDFAQERKLYGKSIIHIPVVMQRLTESYARHCIADILAYCITRAASLYPDRLSLWSGMVKFFVPECAITTIEDCATILGARGFIRSGKYALFQKVRRDNQLVSLFDGSSEVNLTLIAGHLLQQAQKRTQACDETHNTAIYQLDKDIPEFNYQKSVSFCSKIDVLSLPIARDSEVQPYIERLYYLLSQLDEKVITLHNRGQFDIQSLEAMRLSEDYCWIISGLCALRFWLLNPDYKTYKPIIELSLKMIEKRFSPALSIDMSLYQSVMTLMINSRSLSFLESET